MQTRRKTNTKNNSSKENTSNTTRITRNVGTRDNSNNDPKSPRVSKKTAGTTVPDKKVSDLITSSVKKQKPVRLLSKKNEEEGKDLSKRFDSTGEDTGDVSMDQKNSEDLNEREAIFSPTFHHHNATEEEESQKQNTCTVPNAMLTSASEQKDLSGLSTSISSIYFQLHGPASLNKLQCLDEETQESVSSHENDEMEEMEVEEMEEEMESDEFDPYVFIKELPDLDLVVPRFRRVLLPKKTRSCPETTLVLDLDETLVHSTLEPIPSADFTFQVNFNQKLHTIHVKCRPYLPEFLQRVALTFETIIFTASQSIYAEQLLNVLDPKRKLFRHRVYRDDCVYVEGNYLKDLTVLGRDLARVIIVDNSPQAFGFQIDNGVPIESWFDDPNDKELLHLLPFLESLAGVQDVRPLIAQKFNLREKVMAANSLSIDFKSMI
ncbi:hypothetical protein LUZ60_013785 [Juncus effusus]|nr:hypothetical protein LUZ60_013785 [Juncus effusus]